MAKSADNSSWLKMAQEAYSSSTSYFDSNYRKKIEDAYRHAQNRHHAGSKYYKDIYKYRSRGFRPKTRSAINQNLAKGMAAFFSNQDIVSVEPVDINNPEQAASAMINKELLNYRLTKTIPWYQICLGGLFDAQVTGVVCSYQYWLTESTDDIEPVIDDEYGEPVIDEVGNPVFQRVQRIIKDQPVIDLRPIENIRFSPSASWIDPINTSPYLIDLLPMHVLEVEAKMSELHKKTGEPRWKKHSREEMQRATKRTYDTTESTRNANSEDPYTTNQSETLRGYDTVFIHRNFMRKGRKDFVFYTIGTELLLTDPAPIEDVYWHGERPYAFGVALIEPHRVMPDAPVHLASELQKSINENANHRLDNAKMALNKRVFVRRGAQVDIKSIIRNAPGSVTLMNDPASDVKMIDFADVPSSSYQEQDRTNMDFDEITGAFSSSSIGSNRKLGETVGGMSMLRQSGNEINELLIRTMAETWVEKIMRQLVRLEQKYETDEVLLAIAAQKADVYEKYGVDASIDALLDQELTTTVNMGMDATDPLRRTEKLLFVAGKVAEIVQNPAPGLNKNEIIKEIFGSIGFKDGQRFYSEEEGPPPEVQEMQAQMEQMQQMVEQMQMQLQSKDEDRQIKMAMADADLEFKAAEMQAKMRDKEADRQFKAQEGEKTRESSMAITEDQIAADLIKTKFNVDSDNKRAGAQLAQNAITQAIKRADEIRFERARYRPGI